MSNKILTSNERDEVRRLSNCFRNQDNYATACPIYIIEKAETVVVDSDYGYDGTMYVYEGEDGEFSLNKELLIQECQETYEESFDLNKIKELFFKSVYSFEACFLTLEGAEEYLNDNKNKDGQHLRMYVYSGHKSKEIRDVKDIIMNLSATISNE